MFELYSNLCIELCITLNLFEFGALRVNIIAGSHLDVQCHLASFV